MSALRPGARWPRFPSGRRCLPACQSPCCPPSPQLPACLGRSQSSTLELHSVPPTQLGAVDSRRKSNPGCVSCPELFNTIYEGPTLGEDPHWSKRDPLGCYKLEFSLHEMETSTVALRCSSESPHTTLSLPIGCQNSLCSPSWLTHILKN